MDQWLSTRVERPAQDEDPAAPALDTYGKNYEFMCETIQVPDYVEVSDVLEIVQNQRVGAYRFGVLQRESRARSRSRYTIIALDVTKALRVEYHAGAAFATVRAA